MTKHRKEICPVVLTQGSHAGDLPVISLGRAEGELAAPQQSFTPITVSQVLLFAPQFAMKAGAALP